MNYHYMHLKIDQFIGYVNDDKINLIPPFQRGRAWNVGERKKLIENIVKGRPIPAIFLYREAKGDKYEYNILDGKQRLESLILFIGNERQSLRVDNINRYFFDKKSRDCANFKISYLDNKVNLSGLGPELFRDFCEYEIPTIEILLNEDNPASLDELIELFVDINSTGVAVNRFDIVKALSKNNKLLHSTFDLIAVKQKRGKDSVYKTKANEFTKVLKRLDLVERIQDKNSQVDRMWALMVESVLFVRTEKHRTPIEILNSFIQPKSESLHEVPVSKEEASTLRRVYKFLNTAFKNVGLARSKLATNQIHFYAMLTAIIAGKLLDKFADKTLTAKLATFGGFVDGKKPPRELAKTLKEYDEQSAKHTTHPGRRLDRQELFIKAIESI